MGNLTQNVQQTMTSLELREVVNAARAEAGENPVRNDQFFLRIEDELEGELAVAKKMVNPEGGRPQKYYDLTLDQCTLVGMRESKAVRRNVLAQIKRLEKQNALSLPNFTDPIAAAEAWVEAKKAERLAVATKAQISSSREASVMGKLSAASRKMKQLEQELGRNTVEATVTAVEKAVNRKYGKQGFRPLQKWCRAHDIKPNKVPCPRYGDVAAWPAAAWLECYGVDLEVLFGGDGQ